MDTGLRIEGLRVRYGPTVVLENVSLAAPADRITALVGQNGAGKTTLFRALMGLVTADAGSATLNGHDLLRLPLHRKAEIGLGYLPQECASFPELTVRDNLLALLELHPLTGRECQERCDELLSLVGLEALANRAFDRISAGEQRRLEIAKAFMSRPKVLLLDEPFSGLDPCIVDEITAILRTLVTEGTGILITDHNAHSILRAADHGYLLAGGGIVCEGSPDALKSDPEARRLYFGEAFAVE